MRYKSGAYEAFLISHFFFFITFAGELHQKVALHSNSLLSLNASAVSYITPLVRGVIYIIRL